MTHPAETILTHAVIRTMDPARPRATAIALARGTILAIGDEAEVMAHAGPGTAVHDLQGRAVIPGLIDSHTHGLWGATRDLLEVFTGLGSTQEELLDAIVKRLPDVAPGEWLIAGPWQAHERAAMGARPADILDRIAPETPIVVRDVTQHSYWLNSAAMRAAGIDAKTADIPGGEIERDGTGAPTGILRETAVSLVSDQVAPKPEGAARAVRHMVGVLNGYGITAFKEPMAMPGDMETYAQADRDGVLTLHVGTHLSRQSPFGAELTPMEDLRAMRDRYQGGHLHTSFAKLFLDGVAPSHTAAFVEPYLGTDPAAHDPEAMLLFTPEALAAEVTALDAAGYTVKMHAVGDRAVQAALDAIEAARKVNGNSGLRHEAAHCSFIRDEDFARFAPLGAVAEISPKICFPNPVTKGQRAVLGEARTERCHPIGDLLKAGAEVCYGSDWPAAAPDANPWIALAGMISRRDPLGRYPGTLGADQAIPLDEALKLFTVNGARALRLEDRIGHLAPGLSADLVVLKDALEDLTPEQIAAIVPVATLFEGRVVAGALPVA